MKSSALTMIGAAFICVASFGGLVSHAKADNDDKSGTQAGWERAAQYDTQPEACKAAGGEWYMRPRGTHCYVPKKK